jgi:hypothetical protein
MSARRAQGFFRRAEEQRAAHRVGQNMLGQVVQRFVEVPGQCAVSE